MSIQELFRTSGLGSVSGTTPNDAVGKLRKNQDTSSPKNTADAFQHVLENEQAKLTLSQHAETRIRSREIPWNDAIEKRISRGLDQASSKGSREALILADQIAVIANVRSRTVITAMDREQMKERIFTNIDSAVLV